MVMGNYPIPASKNDWNDFLTVDDTSLPAMWSRKILKLIVDPFG